MTKKYSHFNQILFYLVLIVYILLLAKVLLFKYISPYELFSPDRFVTRTTNFVPFESISNYFFNPNFNIWISIMNVAGNIIIFIPLGIYLLVFKKKKKILSSLALTFLISLCVEIIQYTLGIGAADIDDIILNTIGGLLGIFIYKIIYAVLKDETKTRTAITYLFCIAALCFFAFITFLRFSGFRVKIF